jgi:hypothetical protein
MGGLLVFCARTLSAQIPVKKLNGHCGGDLRASRTIFFVPCKP